MESGKTEALTETGCTPQTGGAVAGRCIWLSQKLDGVHIKPRLGEGSRSCRLLGVGGAVAVVTTLRFMIESSVIPISLSSTFCFVLISEC